MSDLEPIVNIVKLPDGRIAAENARDQKNITKEELAAIPHALRLWWELMWASHFPDDEPTVIQ